MPVIGHGRTEVSGKVQVVNDEIPSHEWDQMIQDIEGHLVAFHSISRFTNQWSLADTNWIPDAFSDFEIFRAPVFTHHSFEIVGSSNLGAVENLFCDFVSGGFLYAVGGEKFDDVVEMGSWRFERPIPSQYFKEVVKKQLAVPFSYLFHNCGHKTSEVVEALLAYEPGLPQFPPTVPTAYTHMVSQAAVAQGNLAGASLQWSKGGFTLKSIPNFHPVPPMIAQTSRYIPAGSPIFYYHGDPAPAPWIMLRQRVDSFLVAVHPGGSQHAQGLPLPAMCFSGPVIVTKQELERSAFTIKEYLHMFAMDTDTLAGPNNNCKLQLHTGSSGQWWALLTESGMVSASKAEQGKMAQGAASILKAQKVASVAQNLGEHYEGCALSQTTREPAPPSAPRGADAQGKSSRFRPDEKIVFETMKEYLQNHAAEGKISYTRLRTELAKQNVLANREVFDEVYQKAMGDPELQNLIREKQPNRRRSVSVGATPTPKSGPARKRANQALDMDDLGEVTRNMQFDEIDGAA